MVAQVTHLPHPLEPFGVLAPLAIEEALSSIPEA